MPLPFIPIAAGAAVVGTLGYLVFRKKGGAAITALPPPVRPTAPKPPVKRPADLGPPVPSVFKQAVEAQGVSLAPKPQTVPVATTNPMTGAPMAAGTPTLKSTVQAEGPALPASRALYGYLKSKGLNDTPELRELVKVFQVTSNSDTTAKFLHGAINETGLYDSPTSAALTIYTGDPIPAAPTPPPVVTKEQINNPYEPGAAASSGFNLAQYFVGHKPVMRDPTQMALTKQFQNDWNTDPKVYGGPASTLTLPNVPKAKLVVDGLFGAKTGDALDTMVIKGSDQWNAYPHTAWSLSMKK